MIYKVIILIFILLVILFYLVWKKIEKFKYQYRSIDWMLFLDSIIKDIISQTSMDTLITYMSSHATLDMADAEYKKLLIEFRFFVMLRLGKLYTDIYTKYIFKNSAQFDDYLNRSLYNYLTIELTDNILSKTFGERTNKK